MTESTCSVAGCGRLRYALRWCDPHYTRWRKTGDVRADVPIASRISRKGVCTVDDCGRPREARGMCLAHSRREDKHGDVRASEPIKTRRTGCSAVGCDQPHAGLGWCEMHYKTYRLYRLTPEQYNALLAEQGGGCGICGVPPDPGQRLHVDHDHRCCPTKKRSCGKCVRGLLCGSCNLMIGYAGDDIVRLRRAIEYLAVRELTAV